MIAPRTLKNRPARPIWPARSGPPAARPEMAYHFLPPEGTQTAVQPLLPRVASGDPDAVREVIRRYGGLIWSIGRRLSASREDAEDGVQQVFLQLWKSAARFDPERASETTFIAMVARRSFITRLRSRTRRPEHVSLDSAPDASGRQHVAIESSAEAALACRFLEDLTPSQRQVITLSVLEGMSHQEIAEATGTPLGTVKSHIRRGLQALRARIEAQRAGEEGGQGA